jgi:hypothetical protein
MEPLGDIKVLIGALLVVVIAAARFNAAPPGRPPAPDKTSRALGLLKEAFQFRPEPTSLLFPPPRAQTTRFKFELYRAGYALTGVAVYVTLYAIPGVAHDVDEFLGFISADTLPTLGGAGPILIALTVALLFPVVPPLRAGEWTIRRAFYTRACIPAQQLRETHRLKDAAYVADPTMLQRVRDNLAPEGFAPADLTLEEKPTTRSLWTKAALLMAHLEQWQADDRYKTAFATLREQDGVKRSVDRLGEAYEALKPDARMYFRAATEQPDAPETAKREETFRRNCRDLLLSIYGLLSRVSLHAHYTDRDRVTRLGAIGFHLVPCQSGPIPDPDDVAALSVLITSVVFVPLSYQVSTPRAILISFEIYVAILVPILLAARFPAFVGTRSPGAPALAFPLVAGLAAAAVGVVAHTLVLSVGRDFDFQVSRGWSQYAGRSYPWTFQLLLIAALIAWRMRVGSYPAPGSLRGITRIRQWGSLLDAARFGGASLALMALYIRPQLVELAPARYRSDDWVLLLLPVAIAAVIGFFVPTWYRAHAAECKVLATGGAGSAAGRDGVDRVPLRAEAKPAPRTV